MKGIIFDCDGTLVDSEATHLKSWQLAMQKRGSDLTLEEYFHLAGLPGEIISRRLQPKAGGASPEELHRDKTAFFGSLMKLGLPPIHRNVEFVHALAALKASMGIKLAVASAGHKKEILFNLENLGILPYFDAVVSGFDDLTEYRDAEGVNKPKPYIYLHAAKLIGVDPKRCAAFEDTMTGVKAAVDAGMVAFAVPNAFTKHQDFSQAHHLISPSDALEISTFFNQFS